MAKFKEIGFLPGGILAFSGSYLGSWMINLMTYGIPGWSISHVGIVGSDGKTLYEATAEKGVHCRPIYPLNYNGRIWYYPLHRVLDVHQWSELHAYLTAQLGLPYDAIGASRAGLKGYSWMMAHLRAETDTKMFCSEYVARALSRIGIFETDNTSRWSPNALIRELNRRGLLRAPIRIQ